MGPCLRRDDAFYWNDLMRLELRGAGCGCRFLRDLDGFAAGSGLEGPIRFSAASAARSPESHAPSTVPHNVSCVASPAMKTLPNGSASTRRDGWPPGAAADIAPSANGAAFQRVAADFP